METDVETEAIFVQLVEMISGKTMRTGRIFLIVSTPNH
jgi:hypothetical protein